MDVTLTIHNPPAISIECVKSLCTNREGVDKIIMVDNASSDLTNVHALELMADIVVTLKQQVSLAATWNIGLGISQSDFVLVSNDDIVFAPGWKQPLITALYSDPTIGILQPFNTLSELPENFPDNYIKVQMVGEIPRDNFIGCCFVVRTSMLPHLKRYDKNHFIDWECGTYFYEKFDPFGPEDQDLYRRVRNNGYKTLTHFGSYVHHYTGQTMHAIPDFETLKERSNTIFNERWSWDTTNNS